MNRPFAKVQGRPIASTWAITFLLVGGCLIRHCFPKRSAKPLKRARSSTIRNGSWPDTKQSFKVRAARFKFEELALKFGELEPIGELGTKIRE